VARLAFAGKLSDSIKELKAQSGAFLTTLMATHGENPAVEGAVGTELLCYVQMQIPHAVCEQAVCMAIHYMLLATPRKCSQWT